MSSKPSIPSWQRAGASPASPPASQPLSDEQPESSPLPEQDDSPEEDKEILHTEEETIPIDEETESQKEFLLETARNFLEDDAIRDAPREKKVEFLESKGVSPDDIARLLPRQNVDEALQSITEAGERAWSSAPSQPKRAPAPAPVPQSQSRDIPPIVTYPEFLAQPTQQPPLITTSRLINTAYITGALAATIYGFSKFIVAPMTQNLTESRHDFASHTQEQLNKLNDRLRDAASVDPATKTQSKTSDAADDVSEADSDPTELYHRDFGTQTTPALSRRPSAVDAADDDQGVVKGHENRLKILTSHLRELEATRSNDTASVDSLKSQLVDLDTYLSDMSYQNQYYSGGLYGTPLTSAKSKDGKVDQIEVLKSDIRAVKGVFLSTRNFPSGGRNVTPVGGT